MSSYAKAVVALVTAAAIAAQTALSDGVITASEWVSIAIAALGAIAVYRVPNTTQPATKAQGRHELREDT